MEGENRHFKCSGRERERERQETEMKTEDRKVERDRFPGLAFDFNRLGFSFLVLRKFQCQERSSYVLESRLCRDRMDCADFPISCLNYYSPF